tara:strand:+ start:43993 stop:45204 length:1212 start_codon:yes stop_codon:yes gene_type:complete
LNPIIEVLKSREFSKLWFVGATGMTMRWIETIALGIYVYDLTGDEFKVGIVFFFRMSPMLFFGAIAGVFADQYNKKKILSFILLLTSFIYLLLGISALTGNLNYTQICLGAFFAGIAWSIDFPIRRSLLSETIKPRLYPSAIGLDMTSSNMARIFGPIMAGIVLIKFDLSPIYFFGSFLFLCGFFVSNNLIYNFISKNEKSTLKNLSSELYEGIKYIFSSKILLAVLSATIIVNSLVFTYQSQIAVIVLNNLSKGSFFIGLLAGLEGLGATIGTLLIANFTFSRAYIKIFFGGSFLFAICILIFSQSSSLFLCGALMIIAGLGMSGFGTMQSILVISKASQKIRGRVLGVLAITIGTQPIGAFVLGYFSREYGSSYAVAISIILAIAILLFVGAWYKLSKLSN